MSRMPWLRLRGSVYWCRFAISPDLAGREVPERWPVSLSSLVNPKTGRIKVEFTESLGQRSAAGAQRAVVARKAWFDEAEQEAARFLAGEVEPLQQITASEFAALAEAVKADILASDEALRRRGFGLELSRDPALYIGEPPPRPAFKHGDGLTNDDLGLLKHLSEHKRAQLGRALAMARPDSDTVRRAAEAAAKAGIAVPKDPSSQRDLLLVVLAAEKQAWDDIERRNHGEVVPTPTQQAVAAIHGPKISEAFTQWASPTQVRGARSKSANSIGEAEHAVRRWKEYHGDTRVGDITKANVRDFLGALSRMPVRLPQAIRALPLPKLIETPEAQVGRPPAAGTINKSLRLLSSIVSRAEVDGDFGRGWSNPFRGLLIAEDEGREPPRDIFEVGDLKTIFADPAFIHGAEGAARGVTSRWLPLLSLFTGARLGELAQLQPGDLKADPDGVAYLEITNMGEGGRALKTPGSRRRIPVHSELVKCGFLTFVAERVAEGSPWLFPLLNHARGKKRGDAWGKWFGRKMRAMKLDDGGRKVFHSFRHTMMDRLRDEVEDLELRFVITGHWEGNGKVPAGAGYGRGFSVKRLAGAVEAVAHPGLDLSALYVSPT